MSKLHVFLIGIGVLILGALTFTYLQNDSGPQPNSTSTDGMPIPKGAAIQTVPWKHLQTIPDFQFKTQQGKPLSRADLNGQAYVVNFFFASCPTICKEFNAKIAEINKKLEKEDIRFLSISVDPENDSPEVLSRYAMDYDADPARWSFLTGDSYMVKQIGKQGFNVIVESNTSHSDNILLVDKWGRFRDRFKWDDPVDIKRLIHVARHVAVEQAPPLGESVQTRNALAGVEPGNYQDVDWIHEFWLTERSGRSFYSKDMTGKVWIGNFFFVSCPGICKAQNKYLSGLQTRLADRDTVIVSITTDPNNDSPEVMSEYANELGADQNRWLFCRGNALLTKRIGSEFFKAVSSESHHSSLLFVVDKWGNVRGEFDWQKPDEEVALLKMIDDLQLETKPVATFERRRTQ